MWALLASYISAPSRSFKTATSCSRTLGSRKPAKLTMMAANARARSQPRRSCRLRSSPPSNGAASQDDFPSQRQLARHLSRHSCPVATLRDLPAGEQLPPMVAALARGRAAGQIPYKTDLTNGTTWSRDQHGASLDPTRKLHYRPMAALFHFWVPTAARLRRDELALTLCQWAGMTVEPAWSNGKCRCGQDLDPWRPRARVPLVVWAWDYFCYAASVPWSPGPCLPTVFVIKRIVLSKLRPHIHAGSRDRGRRLEFPIQTSQFMRRDCERDYPQECGSLRGRNDRQSGGSDLKGRVQGRAMSPSRGGGFARTLRREENRGAQ
jgi:hypothetical protein